MCEGGDEKIQKNENEIKPKLRKNDFFLPNFNTTYLFGMDTATTSKMCNYGRLKINIEVCGSVLKFS